jgi:putative redox protein
MSQSDAVVVHGSARGFAQEVTVGRHRFRSDEPVDFGGTDSGPGPYDLLLAALGSCTSMTLGYYARSKQWPLDEVRVTLRHARVYATDCATCATKEGMLDRIEIDIELTGALDDQQRARLLEIADRCPIHRTLTSEISIQARLV